MQVKIERTARELKPLRGAPAGSPLYTGLMIGGKWYNIEGDHQNLYNKVVDLDFCGPGTVVKFALVQQTPTAQTPPKLPPPAAAPTNGHKARWANREDAVEAYIFYATQVEQYIKEPYAIVKAANCLVIMESNGEINPVHRGK